MELIAVQMRISLDRYFFVAHPVVTWIDIQVLIYFLFRKIVNYSSTVAHDLLTSMERMKTVAFNLND